MTTAIARVYPVQLTNPHSALTGHRPSSQTNRSGLSPPQAAIIHIHRHHLLLSLNQKADTNFAIPQ